MGLRGQWGEGLRTPTSRAVAFVKGVNVHTGKPQDPFSARSWKWMGASIFWRAFR